MILEKLYKIEMETKKSIFDKQKKIEAINSIKNFLDQIDFSYEVIPLENGKTLKELFSSLKGKQLSKYEIQLVEDIKN